MDTLTIFNGRELITAVDVVAPVAVAGILDLEVLKWARASGGGLTDSTT